MKLHLFNPENDLALAAGTANFTPPKSVVRFRTALAALPAWLAAPGDNVVAPDVDPSWFAAAGLDVGTRPEGTPEPWGWSANAVSLFRRLGVDGPFPDTDALRRLSHRRTALALHRALRPLLPYPLPPEPMEITSVADLPDTDRIMLKSPWSCSGRGVVDCEGLSADNIRRRAAGSIRRQGSVMVEPKLRRVRDFAMLFDHRRFCGLSVFFNNGTAYAGNLTAPQAELADAIGADFLDETTAAIEASLPEGYNGPLGVDMMVYETDDRRRLICPTVEVNLRKTMGFVALALAARFGRGRFAISAGSPPPSSSPSIKLIPDNPYFSATFTPLP